MKENTDILTLQETEQLCRLYLDCRLSVQDETELRYLLGRLPYTSPVIEEARQSMIAEGVAFREKSVVRTKPVRRWMRWSAGIAASLAVLLMASVIAGFPGGSHADDEMTIAYVGGRKLSPEESEKAVRESMKQAQSLMAMAEAREKEAQSKQQYYMNLVK